MPDPNTPPANPLDDLIAAYLQSVESGSIPDRQALLASHPDLAAPLRAFFADLDRVDRLAAPLRNDDATDATVALTGPAVADAPERVRYFGDYELMDEIARGGMGVVYKARQVSLNRVVALKMILRGALATPLDVIRFRSEAEAVANLDHPNIVPIYEVGEHDGLQYFSMRLIDGRPLGASPFLSPRLEAARLGTIARAVNFAHLRGILHRDLKPSNVLLDREGTPYVTDFGLAKRLTDSDRSLTETGSPVGTPKYMAPEQAAGRKDLTLAADVYSLGVILFERLAGRPPFLGNDVLTLLRQHQETPAPSLLTLNPSLPRDLDIIVRKCLEKEPRRRYPTADALADDIDRWMAGEPIEARAVGRAERLVLWCRRNPVVAGLSGAIVASLLAGIFGSTAFAYRERRERDRAVLAEKEAREAREGIERTFVQSLARPLLTQGFEGKFRQGVEVEFHWPPTRKMIGLTEQETVALWELAGSGPSLGLRYLDEVTRDPKTLRQVRARSEQALVGAIGLDEDRRERASTLLTARLNDRTLPLVLKAEVAFLVLEIEDRRRNTLDLAVNVISQALVDLPADVRESWATSLCYDASRLDPSSLARLLAEALDRETDADTRYSLARSVGTLSNRLDPTEAARVCEPAARILAKALSRVNGANDGGILTDTLITEWDRINPSEVAKFCERNARNLAEALGRERNAHRRWRLAGTLDTMSDHISPSEAARLCGPAARTLADSLARETVAADLSSLASALWHASRHLDPLEAARVCEPAARALAEAVCRATNTNNRVLLASALSGLSDRLSPSEAARVCEPATRALTQAMGREPHAEAIKQMTDELVRISNRLVPSEAARVCEPAARILAKALGEESFPLDREELASALSDVSAQLDPLLAARVCEPLARDLANALLNQKPDRFSYATGLASVSERLDPIVTARTLVEALCRETDSLTSDSLADGLLSVSVRFDPSKAGPPSPSWVRRLLQHAAVEFREGESLDSLLILKTIIPFLPHLDAEASRSMARELAPWAASDSDSDLAERLYRDDCRAQRDLLRAELEAATLGLGFGAIPIITALEATWHYPCRLNTQELIELLKMPTCFDEPRRAVLDQLGNIHGRRFANHWEFVRYARETGLKVDLVTPPKRPDARGSIRRMLEILDEADRRDKAANPESPKGGLGARFPRPGRRDEPLPSLSRTPAHRAGETFT